MAKQEITIEIPVFDGYEYIGYQKIRPGDWHIDRSDLFTAINLTVWHSKVESLNPHFVYRPLPKPILLRQEQRYVYKAEDLKFVKSGQTLLAFGPALSHVLVKGVDGDLYYGELRFGNRCTGTITTFSTTEPLS